MNVDEPIKTFAMKMAKELESNRHKGAWADWSPDNEHLGCELVHHTSKLMSALREGDAAKVSEHAADVANYAMKADEMHGAPLVVDWVVRDTKPGVYKVKPLPGSDRYWSVHFVNTKDEALALLEGAEMHGEPTDKDLGGFALPVCEEIVQSTGCYGRLVFLIRSLEVIVHECVHAADFTMAHYECTEENVDVWHENLATAASNLFSTVVDLRNKHL